MTAEGNYSTIGRPLKIDQIKININHTYMCVSIIGVFSSLLKGWLPKAGDRRATKADECL